MNDLVIAFYKEVESIKMFKTFSKKFYYNLIIYNKSDTKIDDLSFQEITLPNIGLHTHTYLYHIINNYNNLSEVTIFLLGSAFRDVKKAKKAKWLLENANRCKGFMAGHIWLSNEDDFTFELPNYEVFDYKNNSLKANSKRIKTKMIRADVIPLGKWIEQKTQQNFSNKRFYRSSKCMFAVNRQMIQNKPISYYQNLYDLLNKYNKNQTNLELAHYFERAWLAIFTNANSVNNLEHDEKTYGSILRS